MRRNIWAEKALAGGVVCNIGQLSKDDTRELDRLVRHGKLTKWRGHWYPVTGASWGMGPLKTCWSTERETR